MANDDVIRQAQLKLEMMSNEQIGPLQMPTIMKQQYHISDMLCGPPTTVPDPGGDSCGHEINDRDVMNTLHVNRNFEPSPDDIQAGLDEYYEVFTLFTEIKAMLYSVVLPQDEVMKEMIEDTLDIEVIKQQINAEVLDFDKYAECILVLMEILCEPVRDEQIAALKQMTEVGPLFRGIMQTLEDMKQDMLYDSTSPNPGDGTYGNDNDVRSMLKVSDIINTRAVEPSLGDILGKAEWTIQYGIIELEKNLCPKSLRTLRSDIKEAYLALRACKRMEKYQFLCSNPRLNDLHHILQEFY